jgi:glycine/D-amino acid oxidase-like deaminating enzyme
MKSADILIIGGGVIGASCAYHLASRGCKNILVIDRAIKPGYGGTSKATGGFRCQFATETNVKLSLLSREKLLSFKEEIGIDPGYQQYGYLFIASNEREMGLLREAREVQKKAGLTEAREVSPEEISRLSPAVWAQGIAGGTFCETDGFINPMNMLNGYKQAAERLGVNFGYGNECYGFRFKENRITEVFTSQGDISVGSVVNAAGAWAGTLSKMADREISVKPVKRCVAVIKQPNLLPDSTPMTIFMTDGFHFRVRDGRVLLLLPEDTPSSFDTSLDGNWLQKVRTISDERMPLLKDKQTDHELSWAGLYEMTPDKHAVLGAAPGIENFYHVNGSSGHGVMHSPALGQLVSEIVVDGNAKSMNTHPLRLSRFTERDLNPFNDLL